MNVWSSWEPISRSQELSLWHSSMASSHPQPSAQASVWNRTQPSESERDIQPGGQSEYWAVISGTNINNNKDFMMLAMCVVVCDW